MAKIDILMATYNGSKYINEQIDSLLAQTFTDFKLFIYDDASTDNTVELLMKYNDDRIVIIQGKKNCGVNMAFARLLNEVESDYFMICDQDDIWHEMKVEISYNKIVDSKMSALYTVGWDLVNGLEYPIEYKDDIIQNDKKQIFIGRKWPGHAGIFESKVASIVRNNIKKESNDTVFYDVHLYFCSLSLNGVYFAKDKLVWHRYHSNNASTSVTPLKNGISKKIKLVRKLLINWRSFANVNMLLHECYSFYTNEESSSKFYLAIRKNPFIPRPYVIFFNKNKMGNNWMGFIERFLIKVIIFMPVIPMVALFAFPQKEYKNKI